MVEPRTSRKVCIRQSRIGQKLVQITLMRDRCQRVIVIERVLSCSAHDCALHHHHSICLKTCQRPSDYGHSQDRSLWEHCSP